jgi:hypothetical protein
MSPSSGLRSKLLSDLIVFSADHILAIKPLEATDRKMTTGHVLEMLDERIVHRGAAKGANDRKGLRGDLLGHHHPEARRDLGDELRRMGAPSLMTPRSATNRAASVTVLASIPRTAKYPLSDASADPASAQCEDLSTGETRLRVRQIFAFALGNVGY